MGEERRRYFRIKDSIEIGYRLLTDAEKEDPSSLLGTGDTLDSLENDLVMELMHLQNKHPETARVIELLNRKLDMIHHMMDVESRVDMTREYQARFIDLSACGAAFPVSKELPSGSMVLLQINLSAPFRTVRAIAKVVGCGKMQKPIDGDSHMLRLSFYEIHDNDQEMLIQYLMKRQVLELKARREAREHDELEGDAET